VYFLVFRVLTPKVVESRVLVPGAILGGIGWTLLLALGGYLVGHDLRNDSSTYGVFGVVLGLIACIYLGSELTIYAAELNTVLHRHLWPRGLVQPPLTEADQRSMALQATQNQRRPEQEVAVDYNEPAMSQHEWLASGGAREPAIGAMVTRRRPSTRRHHPTPSSPMPSSPTSSSPMPSSPTSSTPTSSTRT